jgi:hypothetical protein
MIRRRDESTNLGEGDKRAKKEFSPFLAKKVGQIKGERAVLPAADLANRPTLGISSAKLGTPYAFRQKRDWLRVEFGVCK